MKKLIVTIKLLLFSLILTSCTSFETKTSGQIGCPVEEIKILESSRAASSATWTAQCRGKTFYCTQVADLTKHISCKEELSARQ
jgi:hypothetical protein